MGKRTLPAWSRMVFLALLLGSPPWARGELVVIVNPHSGVNQLPRAQVINIFMGNHREFPNGLRAKPFDLPTSHPDKESFYRLLVNKDLNQMAAYWSRLVFAGNTSPPVQAGDIQEVIQAVATNRNAIGYVDRQYVDPEHVRIVFALH